MLEEISYATVLGFPVIFWLGLTTLILLLTVASIGYLIHHGNRTLKFSYHKYLAFTLVIVAIIHGGLGILHYFFR